jgi:4'-phosphopantetheinyl transferase
VWSTSAGGHPDLRLSPAERARAGRYRQAEDRARSGTGAALLRFALRHATGGSRVDVDRRCPGCGADDHGPPAVVGTRDDAAWSVSLSHSGDLVTVAVAHGLGHVGVDVERTRPGAAVAALLCTADERRTDDAAPDPGDAWLTRWVRKEAVLKAARVGLTVPMRHLVLAAAHEPARLVSWDARTRPAGLALADVACRDLGPAATGGTGHRGAVATLGGPPRAVHVARIAPGSLARTAPALSPAGT